MDNIKYITTQEVFYMITDMNIYNKIMDSSINKNMKQELVLDELKSIMLKENPKKF